MTLGELEEKMIKLVFELGKVGGTNHNKAASARARKILSEIKNAVPQLRKELIELDRR